MLTGEPALCYLSPMGSNEQFIINSIVKICQKLDFKGFGANHDGNVSAKYGEKIFATPTAVSKGDITPEMIISLDLSGNKIAGIGKPFSEMQLHLAAYRSRPDISAVVHAHPPYATARGIAGQALNRPAIPESVVSIGDNVPVARFALPGDSANINIIGEMLSVSNVFMLPGNGVLSVGADLTQAYLRLELVEHLAKIDFIATHLGEPKYLTDADVAKLMEKHLSSGLAAPNIQGPGVKGQGSRNTEVYKLVEEEVEKALGQLGK